MGRRANIRNHANVAELGAGTGPVTRAILDQLPPTGRLWSFEINPDFVTRLRSRFVDPRLTIVPQSAETLADLAREVGIVGFDAVVSAIPFRMLGRDASTRLIGRVSEGMAPGAPFVAVQYSPFFLPPIVRDVFGNWDRSYFLWNIPPATIFRAEKR